MKRVMRLIVYMMPLVIDFHFLCHHALAIFKSSFMGNDFDLSTCCLLPWIIFGNEA